MSAVLPRYINELSAYIAVACPSLSARSMEFADLWFARGYETVYGRLMYDDAVTQPEIQAVLDTIKTWEKSK